MGVGCTRLGAGWVEDNLVRSLSVSSLLASGTSFWSSPPSVYRWWRRFSCSTKYPPPPLLPLPLRPLRRQDYSLPPVACPRRVRTIHLRILHLSPSNPGPSLQPPSSSLPPSSISPLQLSTGFLLICCVRPFRFAGRAIAVGDSRHQHHAVLQRLISVIKVGVQFSKAQHPFYPRR